MSPKEVTEWTRLLSEGRGFQADETANTNILRQKHAWGTYLACLSNLTTVSLKEICNHLLLLSQP